MDKNTDTMSFKPTDLKSNVIRNVMNHVDIALKEKGYNSVDQLSGYLITNDPAYISSYNNARSVIQQVERYEIIEELVRFYLTNK